MKGQSLSPTTRARIVELLAKGLEYEPIADRTGTSEATVKRVAAEERRLARLREVIGR